MAATHADKRRAEAAAANRRKLRAAQFIRRLKEIAIKAETAEPSAIPAMRLQADIYCKLLAKCLPDLKAVEHSGQLIHYTAADMTEAELEHIAAGGRAGAAEAPPSAPDPSAVH